MNSLSFSICTFSSRSTPPRNFHAPNEKQRFIYKISGQKFQVDVRGHLGQPIFFVLLQVVDVQLSALTHFDQFIYLTACLPKKMSLLAIIQSDS